MKKSYAVPIFIFSFLVCFSACAPSVGVDADPSAKSIASTESAAPATTEHTKHVYSAPINCSEVETCTICGSVGTKHGPHSFTGGDCRTPSSCSLCGAVGKLADHHFEGGDCQTRSVCSVCGAEGALGDHIYDDPTCTNSSVCSVCGEEVLPALGHDITDATCTEAAHCTRCDYVEGEPLGHDGIGLCARCGELGNMSFNGTGDTVVSNINLEGDGIYTYHIVYTGSRYFSVTSYDKDSDRDLLVNHVGPYDGVVLSIAPSPLTLEIEAKGNWSVDIERLNRADDLFFSGKGDFVTPIISCSTGTWKITHNGEHYFGVQAYTTSGWDLLVNDIGLYSGEKYIIVPSGSNLFFEITADGDWTIEKVG